MPVKFNELLLKPDIIELYNEGITPNYGYLLNGRLEKDMVRTLYSLPTLNGNPITWEANKTEMLFPSVSLQPKQAGSGDPSPENVREITGWDSVQVTRCGKNLFDINKLSNNTNGTSSLKNNSDGSITVTVGASSNNAKTKETLGEIIGMVPTDLNYVYSCKSTGTFTNIYLPASNRNWNFNTAIKLTLDDLNTYFCLYASGINSTATISDIQVEQGKTPSEFEPYQGTTATLTFPEIIYGGTVDTVTGVGDNTYIFKELAISDMNHTEAYPGWTDQEWVAQAIPGEIVDKTLEELGCEGIINVYPNLQFRITPYFVLYLAPSNVIFPGLTQSQIKEQYPDLKVQFCLKLATPEPFQATGNQQLTSLLGYNTIYTDGDSMVLNRKARRLEV